MSPLAAPLPLRAGVAPSSTWLADGAEARVLDGCARCQWRPDGNWPYRMLLALPLPSDR